jgi:predicted permease
MRTILRNLRYGSRMLRKSPGFTTVAILTLALGIGANTAIFSVVYAALLRPLPYRQPDRLLTLGEGRRQFAYSQQASYPDFLDWTRTAKSFESMAGYSGDAFTFVSGGEPKNTLAAQVTPNFFSTLGVKPLLGRSFVPAELERDGPHVAILSYSFWQSEFGGDRNIVGRAIRLDNHPVTIVGVLPEGFEFAPARSAPIWVPLHPGPDMATRRSLRWLYVVARLAPGVTQDQTRAEMTGITAQLAHAYPKEDGSIVVGMTSLREVIVGKIRPLLLVLLGAVGFVLLITCANVANLLMTRAIGRRKEFAVRAALGATRGDLLGQLLAESLLLSTAGAAVGLLAAHWGVNVLIAAIPNGQLQSMPYLRDAGINPMVLGFLCVVVLLTAVLFGLAPAFTAAQSALNEQLKEETRGGTSGTQGRLRNAFVVAEIAISLVLLVGAGLMLQSLRALLHQNPGFDITHVLTFSVNLPDASYPSEKAYPFDSPSAHRFERQFRDRLQALPGVVNAASATGIPANGGSGTIRFVVEGRPVVTGQEDECDILTIDANYFSTLKIELASGRFFGAHDSPDSPRVVAVNRAFVKAYLPSDNPIGKRIRYTFDAREPFRQIVGVVGDTAQDDLAAPPPPVIYDLNDQDASTYLTFLVRTGEDPMAFVNTARAALHDMDPQLPMIGPMTLEQVAGTSASVFLRRYPSYLIGTFAGLALILAMVGLYGMIAYTVLQRTREIGIRLTLGAQRGDILRLVLRQALRTSLAGVLIGVVTGLWVTRLMNSLLYGVKPDAWAPFASAAILIVLVAMAASLIPAGRAIHVDPMRALRQD